MASGEIDTFQFFVVFIATVASGDAAGSFFANSKGELEQVQSKQHTKMQIRYAISSHPPSDVPQQ